MRLLSILLLMAFMVSSCGKDQIEEDREIILNYIAENNLDMQETTEGIFYSLDGQGSGNTPSINSKVKVYYKGYFLDGTVFDQSTDNTVEFFLTQVIQGWGIGLQLFKRGESGTLLIPSQYAYGSAGRGSIPSNTVLAFDITLVDF